MNKRITRRRIPSRGRIRNRREHKAAAEHKRPGLLRGIARSIGFLFLASCALAVFALGIYILELDYTVQAKLEGKRWALPARVYARPLELFNDMPLSAEQFAAELKLLPYRKVDQAKRPGTYRRQGNTFDLYTRSFKFWDVTEPARLLRLHFDKNNLTVIGSLDDKPAPTLMRMEPAEIAGIFPSNGEDRVLVQRKDIPVILVDALLAVEDRSFYDHFGIDLRGIMRAMAKNIIAGRLVEGGSTLTQQLVKNFFLSSERSVKRKLNEMLMALLIEAHYEKDAILEAYANEIYLGQDGNRAIHGFGLASRFYFDRTLNELSLHHIAMLVGIIKGPTKFNPRRHPERALNRRALVLNVMVDQGLISREAADMAKRLPLDVTDAAPRAKSLYPAFLDLVHRQLRENYREEDLTSEGLKVFTTLDPQIQAQAETALVKSLPKLEKAGKLKPGQLQAASVIADTQTGEVRAVVGGRDVRLPGFNRALDAKRPAGSLLKPAVYLSALELPVDYTLATLLDDASPLVYQSGDKQWAPRNYDKRMHGWVMLRDALARSYNIPTARLGLELDLLRVISTMKRLGIDRDLKPYPSLLLGALDMSSFEVAQMYATFASGGYRLPLRTINEVTAASGQPLPRLYELRLEKAIEPGPAFLITTAMQQVVKAGTARSAQEKLPENLHIAGKTGTTDDYRDSWFAGFGGNFLSVVWVGRDNNKPINLSGSTGALPLWIETMKRLPLEPLNPHQPRDIEYITIDPENGYLARRSCATAQRIPFIIGSAPHSYSSCGAPLRPPDQDVIQQPETMSSFFQRLLNR